MRKGADSRPTHISRGASARDWNFEWYVRFGSVSERAELRLRGARRARLAGFARKVDSFRETPEACDKPVPLFPLISYSSYVCDPI